MANKYRKKPVIIEAMQWDGTAEGAGPIIDWALASDTHTSINYRCDVPIACPDTTHHLSIPTLEGDMQGSSGDWIIQGVSGEFYPCKPDIFEQTYEKVED